MKITFVTYPTIKDYSETKILETHLRLDIIKQNLKFQIKIRISKQKSKLQTNIKAYSKNRNWAINLTTGVYPLIFKRFNPR